VPSGALFILPLEVRILGVPSIYRSMLKGCPDVLDVRKVSEVLSVSTKTVYKHINEGSLHAVRVGREFRVPKVYLVDYLRGEKEKDGKK
jgi:excisionase family DNA binding protein